MSPAGGFLSGRNPEDVCAIAMQNELLQHWFLLCAAWLNAACSIWLLTSAVALVLFGRLGYSMRATIYDFFFPARIHLVESVTKYYLYFFVEMLFPQKTYNQRDVHYFHNFGKYCKCDCNRNSKFQSEGFCCCYLDTYHTGVCAR